MLNEVLKMIYLRSADVKANVKQQEINKRSGSCILNSFIGQEVPSEHEKMQCKNECSVL